MPSFYDTLGVKKDASSDQIKRAYRVKAAKNHPDKGGDAESMAEINRAYTVLKNPVSRLTYDQTGEEPKDTKDQARDIVLNIFMDLLKKDPQGDYVDMTRTFIYSKITHLKQELLHIDQLSDRLKRKRNKIRKKKRKKTRNSMNLWQVLIDNELEAGSMLRLKTQSDIKAHEDALKILDDYEDDSFELIQLWTTGTTST